MARRSTVVVEAFFFAGRGGRALIKIFLARKNKNYLFYYKLFMYSLNIYLFFSFTSFYFSFFHSSTLEL